MNLITLIDALLPQTQCGKCGHSGCIPYAAAIATGEPINKCPPGGDETIFNLATLLNVPVVALDVSRGAAPPLVAYIREAECIGCTKCIQVCPVDAIVGASKFMHTVIADECTGCDLCVAPCPVDCIEMRQPQPGTVTVSTGLLNSTQQQLVRANKRANARRRSGQRKARLLREEQMKVAARVAHTKRIAHLDDSLADPVQAALLRVRSQKVSSTDPLLKKARINLAMSKAQLQKSLKAFGHPPTFEQYIQLNQLQDQLAEAEARVAQLLVSLASSSG